MLVCQYWGHAMNLDDPRALRSALGMYPTGVTVVTGRSSDGELVGITVNSFSSVSLDPPLVLLSLRRSLRSLPAFDRCEHYAIHVLRDDQQRLSARFAGPFDDKWRDVSFREHATGAPILEGVAAWLACRTYARYDGGDHEIIVGRIIEGFHDERAEPLVFCRGRYHQFPGSTQIAPV